MYTLAYENAVNHAMLYEVGGHWKLTPEVEAGLIETREQRRAVGYVNDPDDAGGETKYGVARNANPDLDITNLVWEDAKAVYYKRYWLAGSCDKLPSRVAVLHFDGCVNHGIARANKFLQRSVGADDDGVIGNITLGLIQDALEIDLCHNICDQREKFYNEIVANKPSQRKYLGGWMRRISEMREFTTDLNNTFE